MSRFGVLFDERFQRHLTGAGHPERPARLDAVRAALEWGGFLAGAERIAPRAAEINELTLTHTADYVKRVQAACEAGRRIIDEPDCGICDESFEIARLAAGGVIDAALAVASGRLERAFCAVRPPGHHAESDRAMGFCLFANVSLAARAAQARGFAKRVLILDWDVHHGNGTQHIFEADPTVMFVSLHGHPDTLYPGTGYAHEVGVDAGAGFTVNVPLRPLTADAEYKEAFNDRVKPAFESFRPDLVIISAGFDAHRDDPIGNQSLTEEAYDWLTRRALEFARSYADGRVLSVLEGGYNLEALRRSLETHLEQLFV